jgi:hypothetical protein
MGRDVAERAITRAYGADKKNGIENITIFTPEGPVSIGRKP